MKKFLAAITVFISVVANAGTWVPISVSVDDMVLSVDVDTLAIKEIDSTTAVTGMMRYSGRGQLPSFNVYIALNDCMDYKNGILTETLYDNNTYIHTWSMDGATMADAQGQFLCGFVREVVRVNQIYRRPARKQLREDNI